MPFPGDAHIVRLRAVSRLALDQNTAPLAKPAAARSGDRVVGQQDHAHQLRQVASLHLGHHIGPVHLDRAR